MCRNGTLVGARCFAQDGFETEADVPNIANSVAPEPTLSSCNEHVDAEETKQAVKKEGRRCITISGDVADPEFCKEAVAQTTKQLGRLDVLVNNAAFQEHVKDFDDLTEAHFDRTIKTNLYGYFYMAKAAVPHMRPGSAIVMTGSVTGLLGNKNLLDYSMTKGGIHAFVRSLATHLIDKGIKSQCRGSGAGVDTTQSCRPRCRERFEIRQQDTNETSRAA
jgi:NAD(P)-dependent dehydrogenase (short-subunit alcohol dehydrogenase family)